MSRSRSRSKPASLPHYHSTRTEPHHQSIIMWRTLLADPPFHHDGNASDRSGWVEGSSHHAHHHSDTSHNIMWKTSQQRRNATGLHGSIYRKHTRCACSRKPHASYHVHFHSYNMPDARNNINHHHQFQIHHHYETGQRPHLPPQL